MLNISGYCALSVGKLLEKQILFCRWPMQIYHMDLDQYSLSLKITAIIGYTQDIALFVEENYKVNKFIIFQLE